MNLRQRVEDRAGRLPHELQRAAHVEGAVQRFLGAGQIAEADVNLPERGQRDAESVRRPGFLLELHASLGQRQRLLVPMLHRGDVRLVSEDRREDVARLRGNGQPLRVAHRNERLFEPPFLGERDARQRMNHGQVTPVAGGVQRRCGRGQVLANDRRIADLPVAERQLVLRKADRPGIVRALGEAEGFGEEGDAARRLSPGGGNPAMHAPEVRQSGGIGPLADIGRSPKRFRRLPEVVLQQPGLRQSRPNPDLILPGQAWLAQRTDEKRRRLGPVPMFEGFDRAVV